MHAYMASGDLLHGLRLMNGDDDVVLSTSYFLK